MGDKAAASITSAKKGNGSLALKPMSAPFLSEVKQVQSRPATAENTRNTKNFAHIMRDLDFLLSAQHHGPSESSSLKESHSAGCTRIRNCHGERQKWGVESLRASALGAHGAAKRIRIESS